MNQVTPSGHGGDSGQAVVAGTPGASGESGEIRWFAVQAQSNAEKLVAERLEEAVRDRSVGGAIKEVLLPTEKVLEVRRGARREVERRIMPGYVLVRMEMNRVSRHFVVELPRVIDFVGAPPKAKAASSSTAGKGGRRSRPRNQPTPLPEAEVEHVRKQVADGVERPRPSVTFSVGEDVRVVDGPFESFSGQVEEVYEESARLKITIIVFGRPTPVELEFGQVQKTA